MTSKTIYAIQQAIKHKNQLKNILKDPFCHADNILEDGKLTIIDESFCDLVPEKSLIRYAKNPGVIVLKSFVIHHC